jgi:hypothetical protein
MQRQLHHHQYDVLPAASPDADVSSTSRGCTVRDSLRCEAHLAHLIAMLWVSKLRAPGTDALAAYGHGTIGSMARFHQRGCTSV